MAGLSTPFSGNGSSSWEVGSLEIPSIIPASSDHSLTSDLYRSSVVLTVLAGLLCRTYATLAVRVSGTDFDVSQIARNQVTAEGACATAFMRNEEEKSLRHVDPILRLCCARSPANNRSIAALLMCA
jgi:hypothetical protein